MTQKAQISGKKAEYPYKKFKVYDSTPISVEMWNDQNL